METRIGLLRDVARGLLARTKKNFETHGESMSVGLAERLELILISATDIHLRRLSGDDYGADIEETILRARLANFRSSVATNAADVFNDTIEDAFMTGASVIIKLI